MTGVVQFDLQGLVGGLERQDGSDAGQIEAVVEELADLSEADEIVIAVAAGAALAAGRTDQAPSLVEPKILWSATHQLGRYRDSVQAPVGIGTLHVCPAIDPSEISANPLASDMAFRI